MKIFKVMVILKSTCNAPITNQPLKEKKHSFQMCNLPGNFNSLNAALHSNLSLTLHNQMKVNTNHSVFVLFWFVFLCLALSIFVLFYLFAFSKKEKKKRKTEN